MSFWIGVLVGAAAVVVVAGLVILWLAGSGALDPMKNRVDRPDDEEESWL